MPTPSPTEPDSSDLIDVARAIEIIDATAVAPRVERRPLLAARGLRLAADLLADRDFPPFDKSQMDGFAVRSADLRDAAFSPVTLTVTGEVAAGQWPNLTVGPGEAVAIMTGAPLPPGADAVIPIERVDSPLGGPAPFRRGAGSPMIGAKILLSIPLPAWAAVARRGSDAPMGAVVLPAGSMLEAAQLAVAASVGAATVPVFARPRVAVLGTGDEVVPVDQAPGPAQIRNSNGVMLISLLAQLGCDVTDLGVAPDRPEAIRAALVAGLAFDALFVTGGMSMGAYDYVPQALIELGVGLKITKVRLKPGKPFVFGVGREGQFVFGLPGNPVSAMVCTIRFATRLLARLGGAAAATERWLTGRLEKPLPSNGPREFYQPAAVRMPAGKASADGAMPVITPLTWKGSADLFTLAAADALLVRAADEPAVAEGAIIRVLRL